MTTYKYIAAMLLMLMIVPLASAVPTTGAATLIGSNNVTITLTGCTGTDAWIVWGQNSNGYAWNSGNYTPVAGTAVVLIYGAPLLGGTYYYAKGCDSSGCGGEITFTTLPITPLPITTFGAGYRNLSASHFNIMYIAPAIEGVYSPVGSVKYGFPRILLYGIIISMVFIGLWFRTRSIRLCSSMALMFGGMLFYPTSGLMLGIPASAQILGGVLLALGITGWLVALWLKK